jgi:hypothetical protein
MLSVILAIFGSSGFGALLGGATGLAKAWLDQRNRAMELAHEKDRWAHELDSKKADLEIARAEAEGKREVAIVEGAAQVESAAYQAMAAAYAADKVSDKAWEVMASSAVGRFALVLVELLQKSVRPLLTYALTGSALYLNFWIIQYTDKMWLTVTAEQRLALVTQIVSWVLFQASAVVGYWFVNRPTPSALSK